MPRRCVLGGCSNTNKDGVRLHRWPANIRIGKQWTRFVKSTRIWSKPSQWSHLCSAHFESDCYSGTLGARLGGYGLILKDDAVPTLRPKVFQENAESNTKDHLSFLPSMVSTPTKKNVILKREKLQVAQDLYYSNRIADNEESHNEKCCMVECDDSYNTTGVQALPDVKSKGIQTFLKPKSVSIGIQCTILEDPPICISDGGIECEMKSVSDCDTDDDDHGEDDIEQMEYEDDPDYHPNSQDVSFEVERDETKRAADEQRVFLVYEECLISLFKICSICSSECVVLIKSNGTAIQVRQTCVGCDFMKLWNSQPYIKNTPAGNLMLSSSILFSGSSIAKALLLLRHLKVQSISYQTYLNHQRYHLHPTIKSLWDEEQVLNINEIKQKGGTISAAGDGRADSPGHSAHYGSYTLLDTESNKVVHMELVTVTEVKNSNAMEKEGLIRALTFLDNNGVKVKELTTDRHTSIRKYLREKQKDINHTLDVWHVAKGVGKKIDKLGKKKGCEKANLWKKSIVHHLYWTASSTPDADHEMLEAKWLSIVNHVQNIHTKHGKLFPRCLHEKLKGKERKNG